MNWRCGSTKLFVIIYLNLEIYYIVREKLSNIFSYCVLAKTSYIAQMQYMYDSSQTLFHTAILGGEWTVMKISTKCNRCDLFQPCQNYLHGQLVVTLSDFARAKQVLQI